MTGIRVSAEEHHGRYRRERKRDVRYEKGVYRAIGKQAVRKQNAMYRRKYERVRTEYLRRDFVFRSKDGEGGEGDYRKCESEPPIKRFKRKSKRRSERIRDSVERKVEKQKSEIVRSGF